MNAERNDGSGALDATEASSVVQRAFGLRLSDSTLATALAAARGALADARAARMDGGPSNGGLPLPPELEHLVALAGAASEGAHAPYSQLSVGAVVVAADGSVFAGCNVESASYGLTLCAERAALASARVGRAADLVLVVLTSSAGAIPPCGACRQLLVELAPDAIVVSAGHRAGPSAKGAAIARTWTAAELLPDAFDADGLPERRAPGS